MQINFMEMEMMNYMENPVPINFMEVPAKILCMGDLVKINFTVEMMMVVFT